MSDIATVIAAEQALVGALLQNPATAWPLVQIEGTAPSDFGDNALAAVFAAIRAMIERGEAVDVLTVWDTLGQMSLQSSVGDLGELAKLEACVPSARNAGRYAAMVAASGRRRRVATAATALARAAADTSGSTDDERLHQLLDDLVQHAQAGARATTPPFVAVPMANLADIRIHAPQWIWEHFVPEKHLTVLSGHGGVGKSLVALMMAVAVATGRPLFGVPTTRCRVAYFSGEDHSELVLQRLLWVCAEMGADPAELDGWLHILDATEGDPSLFREVAAGGQRLATTTATHAELARYVERHEIGFLVLDNMSDTFDANEIERAKVRGFLRAVLKLRKERRLSVLLLAHVDKATARGERSGTDGYSGSTAVHNTARSRLHMSRDKDGALRIEHHKCNLGPLREPLLLRWPEGGLPQLDAPLSGQMRAIARSAELRALLRLVDEFTGRGEYVATSINSAASASRLLRGEPGYPDNRQPGEVQALLRDAERDGLLQRLQYRTSDRKPRERWELTDAGRVAIGRGAPGAPGLR